jgi:uncharacterized membrane protein YidH (DUF202 family)
MTVMPSVVYAEYPKLSLHAECQYAKCSNAEYHFLGTTTLSLTTFSIMILNATVSITTISKASRKHLPSRIMLSVAFFVILSLFVLSVAMLNVVDTFEEACTIKVIMAVIFAVS